jgi:exodeoxyribonuclease VII small subunit
MVANQELSKGDELSFEDALAELEEIVQQLEGNTDSLADSVALFQRGRKLADFCQELLDKAELQITKLNQADDGTQTLQPLVIDSSDV